jgi:hypothetical protein
MTLSYMHKFLALIGIPLLLTACESVKSTLGMDHYQADEFNIKQNDPLEVPPNYKLMPPRTKDKDGKSIPLNASAAKAQKVIGGDASEAALSETSKQDLKDKTGSADESIRKKIDEEAKEGGDSDAENKLNAWKKEFIKNAKSINSNKNKERPVEKLKEQLKHESAEHHETSAERAEVDEKQQAVELEDEKGIINADRIEQLREHR